MGDTQTAQGGIVATVWGWGAAIYGAFKWSMGKDAGGGQEKDPEDDFFSEEDMDEDEPVVETREPSKVQAELETPVTEKTGLSQEISSKEALSPGGSVVAEPKAEPPKTEKLKAEKPKIEEPEAPKITLSSVKKAAALAQPRILTLARASKDAKLEEILVKLRQACGKDPVAFMDVDGLLKQAEARIGEIEPGLDKQVKDLMRRLGEEVVKFNKEEKRLLSAGNNPGVELRAEFTQSRKIIDATISSFRLNTVGKDDLSLGELNEQLVLMQANLVELGKLKPEEAEEEIDETAEIPKSVTKQEYPFGAGNKIPHIHNYDNGFHLKYLAGTKVKRLNLVQAGTRYEPNIAEAMEYATIYAGTPAQRRLKRVLEALL